MASRPWGGGGDDVHTGSGAMTSKRVEFLLVQIARLDADEREELATAVYAIGSGRALLSELSRRLTSPGRDEFVHEYLEVMTHAINEGSNAVPTRADAPQERLELEDLGVDEPERRGQEDSAADAEAGERRDGVDKVTSPTIKPPVRARVQ